MGAVTLVYNYFLTYQDKILCKSHVSFDVTIRDYDLLISIVPTYILNTQIKLGFYLQINNTFYQGDL